MPSDIVSGSSAWPASRDPLGAPHLPAPWTEVEGLAAEEQSQGVQLLEYLRVILKHKWVIVTTVVVALAIGLVITLLTPRLYTSDTTIEIDRQAPDVTGVGNVTQPTQGGIYFGSDQQFFETQYGLLKSWALSQRVAQSMGLVTNKDFLAANHVKQPESVTDAAPRWAVGYLQGGLQVTPVKDSQLVRVAFESPSPDLSANIANAFAQNFIQQNLERRFQASAYARKFLEQRIDDLKSKLEDSQRQLVAYAIQQRIIDLNGVQGASGGGNLSSGSTMTATAPQPIELRDLGDLNDQLNLAKAGTALAEDKYKQTLAAPGLEAPDVLADNTIQQLRQTRATLTAQYMNQLKIYKPDYPDMLQLKAQIAEIDKELGTELNTIRQSLKTGYQTALATQNSLQEKVDQLKTEALDLQKREIQYQVLQGEVTTNETLYQGLLERYKEIGVAGGATTNNISIVDTARPSHVPSEPQPVRNMAIAGLGGLALGVMLAFLLETLDQAVRKPADIEAKLGLPVLGSVPLLEKGVQPLEAIADARSPFSEAYHSIRSNLAFTTKDGVPRILAVTSAQPEEGKSTTAFALAQGFAKAGLRVLLVDLDLRNPSAHKICGVPNRAGASNLLTGAVLLNQVVQTTSWPNLSVVPSGPLPPSPAELLIGPRLAAFAKEAAETFDMVVLDSPPVMGLADAPLICSAATGTLLTIEAGRTSRAQARGAIRRLKMSDTHLVGSVLTKFDSRKMAYGYGYAYAYDYEYNYQYGRVSADKAGASRSPVRATRGDGDDAAS